ncbi:MAG TPA: hypothetical protein VKV06_06000, partial [Acidimicrobiales bacterium]|nr:hypothetical protein [Acidimicrobiales bacterium]
WINSKGQPVSPAPWTRASGDAVSGVILSDLIRRPVDLEVPGRKVNGFDLLDSTTDHETLVIANVTIVAGQRHPKQPAPVLLPRQIVLVNGMNATPAQLQASLDRLQRRLEAAELVAVPLSRLR